MLERARNLISSGLEIVALRVAGEPRSVGQDRVYNFGRTRAGVVVTPDNAVTIAAFWAAVRYLSQTVAVLPWHVMADGDGGATIQKRHPIEYLLYKRPNPEWSSFQFRETLTHWALRWGNGYAEIEPDQAGRPFALWPIHPDRVEVCRATEPGYSTSGDAIPAGAIFYEISNGDGGVVTIAAQRMYHVRGFGEGPVGVNVVNYAAESLGWVKAVQLFGAAFFGNGATPSAVIKNKRPIGKAALRLQRAEFEKTFSGPSKAHRVAVLDADAEVEWATLDAEKSQLIETHQFLVEEICRWVGVPPHKVMHLLRATFSNIEHQAIEVVVDSVSPWVKRFEDEADFKLFGQNRQGLFTKMNMRALLRGDFKSQNEGLKIARESGVINGEEWREYLDLGGIGAQGKKYVMQSQYTTLEKIGEEPAEPKRQEPAETSSPPTPEDELTEDGEAMEARMRFEALMSPNAELLQETADV